MGLEAGSYKEGYWEDGKLIEYIWYDKQGNIVSEVKAQKPHQNLAKARQNRSIIIESEWNFSDVENDDGVVRQSNSVLTQSFSIDHRHSKPTTSKNQNFTLSIHETNAIPTPNEDIKINIKKKKPQIKTLIF